MAQLQLISEDGKDFNNLKFMIQESRSLGIKIVAVVIRHTWLPVIAKISGVPLGKINTIYGIPVMSKLGMSCPKWRLIIESPD